jgi:hypothetical protein
MDQELYWIIYCDSNKYRTFDVYDHQKYFDIVRDLYSGVPLIDSWTKLSVQLYADDKGKEQNKPYSDFMHLSEMTINCKAKQLLDEMISRNTEYLPIDTPIGDYWLLNIYPVDCINLENSIVEYFSDGGVLNIEVFDFYYEKIQGTHIFITPELRSRAVFVTQTFKQYYSDNKLSGLLFCPVPLAK